MEQLKMIFIKKIIRDLYKNKSRSFSIMILIFLSFVIAGVYVQPGAVLDATYSKMKTDTNKADIIIDAQPFSNTIFNDSVYDIWTKKYNIIGIQPRLLLKGNVEIGNEFKVFSHIIGIPDNQRPIVNDIITPNNIYFSNNQQEAFIETSYVNSYRISNFTFLNVALSEFDTKVNFPIIFKDKANSIEYPFIESAGGGYERSTTVQKLFVMSVFAKVSYLQQVVFGGIETYNQICIKFASSSDKDQFINDIRKDNSDLSLYIKDI